MLFVLEGPDCCGKTTVYNYLKGRIEAHFAEVPSPNLQYSEVIATRDLEMWEALYDPGTLYVCDRHVLTSDQVYCGLFGRRPVRRSRLESEVFVAYIDTPLDELLRRRSTRGDWLIEPDHYEKLIALYNEMLDKYPHVRITTAEEALCELVYMSARTTPRKSTQGTTTCGG